jgi:TolA-binding protein
MFATAAKWSCAVALTLALASSVRADEGDDLFASASAQYSARQYDVASDTFGKYLHEFPGHRSHAKGLFFRGESLVQLGRYAEAYPLFRDLLAEDPTGPYTKQATFRTAEAAAMSGKLNEAQIYLSQFQSKYPADKLNARVLLYQGSIAMRAGDLSGAERCYRQSIERFGDSPTADECRIALVHTLQLAKQPDAADEVLHEVAKSDHSPWTETALLQLASKEFAAQKPQAALEYCAEVGTRFPSSPMLPQAKLGYARALCELKRYDEAQPILTELASIKDYAADARHWLTIIDSTQRQQKLAAEEADRKAKLATEEADRKAKQAAADVERQAKLAAAEVERKQKVAAEEEKVKAKLAEVEAEKKRAAEQQAAQPAPQVAATTPAPATKPAVADAPAFKSVIAPLRNPAAKKPEPQFNETQEMAAQREDQNRRRSAAIRFEAADTMIRAGDYGRAIATLQIGDNSGDDPRSLTNRYLLAVALKGVNRAAEAEQTLDELNTTLAAKLSAAAAGSGKQISAEDFLAYRDLNERLQLARANALLSSERFADAIEPLQSYVQSATVESKIDWAYANLARCLARTSRFDEARKSLDEFKSRRGQSELLQPAMLEVADAAASAGQYLVAAQLYRPLSSNGMSAEFAAKSLVGLGWCQFRMGDQATAAETFGQFIDRFPSDAGAPDAALARGQALEQQEKFEPALTVYRQSMIRYPKAKAFPQFLAATARLYDQLGQDEKALPLYERIVREYPNNPDLDATLYGWAWCLRDLGRGKESDKAFRQLYEQLPNSRFWADATFRLAERAVQHGERNVAATYVDQLLSVDCPAPVLQHTLYLQAQIAISDQKWSAAEPLLQRLVEEHPDCALRLPAEFWLAEVSYRGGDFNAAMHRFDALTPRISQRDETWMAIVPLRRAQMLAEQKQWSTARTIAESIVRDFPQFDQQFEADYVIGRCFAAEGNFDAARAAFQRVVRSSAGSKTETAATAQYMIGDTYFQQQTYSTAFREFMKVESAYHFARWQAAALRHAAMCQEQMGHPKEAADLVARARQSYEEPEHLAERLKDSPSPARK